MRPHKNPRYHQTAPRRLFLRAEGAGNDDRIQIFRGRTKTLLDSRTYETRTREGMAMSPNPSFYEIKVAPVAKLENGYTRIANELLEALVTSPFTPSQLRVILGIARFTYGYSKRTALVPTKKIADFCEIKPWLARYAVAELISAQVLFREGGQRGEIGINNHIDQWRFPQDHEAASVGKSQHSKSS